MTAEPTKSGSRDTRTKVRDDDRKDGEGTTDSGAPSRDGRKARGGAKVASRTGQDRPRPKDGRDEAGQRRRGSQRRGADDVAPARESDEGRRERIKANIKTIVGAIALAMVIRIAIFEAFEIEGPSMEPTLLNGDRVVVAKFSYGLRLPRMNEALFSWGMPNRGDVVIVTSPADDVDIVKRVIGIPGDVIEIEDDAILLNGRAIDRDELGPCETEDPGPLDFLSGCVWVRETIDGRQHRTSYSRDAQSLPSNHPATTVPEGHIYIMGDHRDHSNDSRFFGVVPVERVKGHALFIYWSSGDRVRWDRIGSGLE